MIFPDIPAEKWAEKMGIIIDDVKCNKCGQSIKLNQPILMKDYAGLQAKYPCKKCGNKDLPVRVVPCTEKTLALWEGIRPIYKPTKLHVVKDE